MGLCCAVVGLLCGLWVRSHAAGDGYQWFPAYSTVAGGASGSLFWWILVARRGRYSRGNCAMAGAVIGLVAHYLCWYLMISSYWLCAVAWGGCGGSLGESPMNPIFAVFGAGVLSLWSLVFLGWVTVPAGALLGALFAERSAREKPGSRRG